MAKYDIVYKNLNIGGKISDIAVKDGKIAVTEASCPDHYCMQRGYCHSGAQIVCLPNRLVISFLGAKLVVSRELTTGQLNAMFTYLIDAYPHSFIFMMTPLHRSHEEEASFNTKNPNSLPLIEYVRIIRQMAERYSIPVLDLYAVSNLNPELPIIKETFMPDGLHPNDAGHTRIASRLEGFLKAL